MMMRTETVRTLGVAVYYVDARNTANKVHLVVVVGYSTAFIIHKVIFIANA